MALTIKEVEHIALLARIEISEDEKKAFAEQLSAILQYADKLNELDTTDTVPLDHILPIHNVFREDEVITSPSREDIFANAPESQDGYFKVPRIL